MSILTALMAVFKKMGYPLPVWFFSNYFGAVCNFQTFSKAAGYLQNFVLVAIIKPTYIAFGNGRRYQI